MVKFSAEGGSDERSSPKRLKIAQFGGASSSSTMADRHRNAGKSLLVAIEPDTIECNICMEPLSPPVFQCSNGHIACAKCCALMENKCHSCSKPIGRIRCLAIEKLIESLKVCCKYNDNGCTEMCMYSQRTGHESRCSFAPYLCPISGCGFFAPSLKFSDHLESVHGAYPRHFEYDTRFTLLLDTSKPFYLLKCEDTLFLVNNKMKPIGNVIFVTFIGPASLEEHYSYQIEIRKGRRRLLMENVPYSIVRIQEALLDGLFIPVDTYDEDCHFRLELSFHCLL